MFGFATPTQYLLVQSRGQQVVIRQFGQPLVATNLLMPSERHVPRRKSKKNHPLWCQELVQKSHEAILIWNVFDHIFEDDQVKPKPCFLARVNVVDVAGDEPQLTIGHRFWHKGFGRFDPAFVQFNAYALTTFFQKSFEYSGFATTNFQNFGGWR